MNTELATTAAEAVEQPDPTSTANLILHPGALEKLERFAMLMAKGNVTVPQHLRGNVADCMAVSMQATQWGMSPFVVAQKTHLVKGTLGYESQLVGAVLVAVGAIQEKALFDEYFGDWSKVVGKFVERESKSQKNDAGEAAKFKVPNWSLKDEEGLGIRVWATLPGETKPRVLEMLMTQAVTRNSTLWANNPQQQLFYLAQKMWARKYAPGALLGVYTVDELDQAPVKHMGAAEVVSDVRPKTLTEDEMALWNAAAAKGTAAANDFWKTATKDFRTRASEDQKAETWRAAVAADEKRTVDNDKPEPAKTTTAKQDADPATGETTPPPSGASAAQASDTASFVADMENAERGGRS